MATTDELLDILMKDYKKPEDLIGENGLLKQLTKRLLERAMQAEMTDHLGYEKHAPTGKKSGNSRNGGYKKTVKGEFGNLDVAVPRDRNSTFEPMIIPKGESRFTGFDDKIISMYARGMTTRDIQGHLEEIYGVEVSPTLISQVTEAVTEEIKLWQSRPLDEVYPIVYLDAVRIKVRHNGQVINKAVYLAIAVTMEGVKEVLGMWAAETEGAKFWLQVVTELKNRGVKDIFIACVDGLKGFPEAIEAVFPNTQVQLCIVHMVRNSLNYVSWGVLGTVYRTNCDSPLTPLVFLATKTNSVRSQPQTLCPFCRSPPKQQQKKHPFPTPSTPNNQAHSRNIRNIKSIKFLCTPQNNYCFSACYKL